MPYTPSPLEGKPPTGLGGVAVNKVEQQLKAQAVMPSTDIMVDRTTGGTFLHLRSPGGVGGSGLKLVEVTIDDTRSEPLSGTTGIVTGTVSGASVKVLLPPYLHTTAPNGLTRKPDSSARIKPEYKINDIIYCVAISKGADDETYIDLNLDARRWSVEIQFCENGVSRSYWLSVIK